MDIVFFLASFSCFAGLTAFVLQHTASDARPIFKDGNLLLLYLLHLACRSGVPCWDGLGLCTLAAMTSLVRAINDTTKV